MGGSKVSAMVAVVGASVLTLAGCGGGSGDEGRPFAGKSADRIAAEAVKATGQAASMHVSGTVRQTARTTTSGGKSPDTATFSDYGKTVDPRKPAAGETVDLKDLASSGQPG
ncbi:hypothetical protein ABZ341_07250 [Streptomyces sp. NPDC006173]|uniref:hypothetical protein n=1 Tax=Streptomyces sp. NPDC006173 TaxID=3155349 RepID=UPI0033C10A1E